MADKQSQEKIDILRAVGAEVVVCPTNVEPDDPRSYYSVAQRLSREIPNSIYMNQYDNLSNRESHYLATGPELWEQTEGKITHFVAGMGTCGTITGIARYLKEQNPDIKIIGVDTYGSVFKKLHETGEFDDKEIYPYLTEGIGEDIVPENCDMSLIDQIIKVTDKDAALMTRKLARHEGLFVGWSCGSAVQGALEAAKDMRPDDLMVVILPDHGTRYLGKVYNDAWMQNHDFLDKGTMLSAEQIIQTKDDQQKLLTVDAAHTLAEAIGLMRERNVSQIPVTNDGNIVGSLSESRVLNTILDDPSLKNSPVSIAMGDAFPFVLGSTRLDMISKLITRDNPAVLVQQTGGGTGIITEYDLIQALAM